MTDEKKTVHNDQITVLPRAEGDANPGEKIVHGTAQTKGLLAKDWKWTTKKWKALKLMLAGASVLQVAKSIGKHRNTVHNWSNHPVWQAEMATRLRQMQSSTKLRRVRATTVLADKLASKSLKLLSGKASKIDVARAGLVGRMHLEYAKAERAFFGENAESGATPMVNIIVGGNSPGSVAPVADEKASTAVLAFEEFMMKYSPDLAVEASSPQEAAALIAEKVLQESNLVDIIREEDREVLRKESEAADAAKAKRR